MEGLNGITGFYLLLTMLIMHWIVDFHQGWMAAAKRKDYWESNFPPMNHNDYIPVLSYHAFMWTVGMMSPMIVCMQVINGYQTWMFIYVFTVNFLIHLMIDNMKNNNKINLVIDQILHLIQIVLTYILLLMEVVRPWT